MSIILDGLICLLNFLQESLVLLFGVTMFFSFAIIFVELGSYIFHKLNRRV